MSATGKKVVVLPCSGIGKVYGALARETAYELTERVRPEQTAMTCLPLLVIKDEQAMKLINDNSIITIDGCPKSCAFKNVEALGKNVSKSYEAIHFHQAHKDLKPEGVAELNETGRKLAAVAAEELAKDIDELVAKEEL
jgi:uncharacterized metal-binding protein